MKRKLVSILTALALCLSLLPGTALAAEGDPVVSINNSPLVSGKQYVASGNGVVEKTETTPADTPYLDYNDGVLTVHGQMGLQSCYFRIVGNVTFTGGEGSCLETGTTSLGGGTLTLSGSVDFKPQLLSGDNVSTNKLTTTNDYSGDIAIQSSGSSSSSVLWDVKNSASISIMGMVSYSSNTPTDPITLKSAGDINIESMLMYHTVTIAGKNVSLKNGPVFQGNSLTITAEQDVTIESSTLAIMGAAEVSARGNVTISSGSTLVSANSTNSLTVKNAKSVSIQGKTNESNTSLLAVPVTFENCGNVTVTDTGTGEILKEGVAVTSDKPWTATAGGKTVTMPSGRLTYGGNITSTSNGSGMYVINSADPIVYDAGEGKVFYEPATAGGPAVLTLDGASDNELWILPANPVQMELKGENQIKKISTGALTLTGTGSFAGTLLASEFTNNSTGTLNALVGVNRGSSSYKYTMYGACSTSDFTISVNTSNSLTIAEGATLTVDTDDDLTINGLEGLTNHGTIINNSVIKINTDQNADDAAVSAFIKSLNLTGSGDVSVKKGSGSGNADTYTNSGTKLLPPAGTDGALDLSSADTEDTRNWDTLGYKWTDVVKDETSGNITSATLTLAPGFNATSVKFPDAAVTIETTGESRIDELVFNDKNPQKTELTFSGTEPLTVDKRINLAGGSGNTITVAEGAKVMANNGVYVGATGESSVTVSGTLKAAGFTDHSGNLPAVSAGKVEVSNTGVLEVSGAAGVLLNGMSGVFTNLFTVTGDGRFTANCSEYNVQVVPSGSFPDGTTAEGVINLGDEYMPDDCKAELKDGKINLVRISTGEVYSGPLTIHKNHTWSSEWTQGETTHWHACEFAGCTAKQPGSEAPHYYAHGATACRDCGHTRPAGTPDSDSGGSGGSGGGSSSSYAVTVEKTSHGEVASDRRTASQGDTVTLTVTPDSGYGLSALTVTDSRGGEVALTHQGGGTYRFTMPGRAVTVRAAFASSACTGGADCPSRAFSDLDTGKWYHEAVDYVLKNGLMSGYGSGLFGPEDNLTRAQFTQILHNKEGRPVVNYLLQYSDVADGAWYTEAIRWATSQGVVNGYGNGRFGPNDNITREQLAVMLWRYAGSPAAAGEALHFTDADQAGGYALDALGWAVKNGILNGKGGGILDPKGLATRAQATQMLKNFLRDA